MIVKDGVKSSSAPISARSAPPAGSSNLLDLEDHMQAPPPYSSTTTTLFAGFRHGAYGLGEPARVRFWRAFCLALVVCALLGMLVRSVVELALVSRHHGKSPGAIAKDWPEFSTGEVDSCIDRPDWPYQPIIHNKITHDLSATMAYPPYHSSVSFSLPADADLLYFLSRGSLAQGTVRILAADLHAPRDAVQVDVSVGYWYAEALERASVCRLSRRGGGSEDENEHGVGIFTPRNWHAGHPIDMRDRLYFDVVVRLPAARVYRALDTDFENFAHEFGDLLGKVDFTSLDVKTSNAYIASESLNVETGVLKTSNGAICGAYNTSTSLKLVTSNAKIAVDVSLINARLAHPTELVLKTSNGAIDSALALLAAAGTPGANSAFAVQALTSNAPNFVHVYAHPPGAPLAVDIKTSNAAARAALHPAYEGAFALRTSLATPRVTRGRVADPEQGGRERTVELARVGGGEVTGRVWWGAWAGWKTGWCHMASSNAPVELVLKEVGEA